MKRVMLAVATIVLISCGGGASSGAKTEKELLDAFKSLNATFTKNFDEHGDKEALKASADTLVMEFDALVKAFPESGSLSGLYFSIGEVSMKVDRAEEAVKYFDALEAKYPESEQVSKALYLKGQTFENLLKDTVQAIASYKHLYKTYPESEWSQNAKNQVLHLNNPTLEQD